MKKICLVCNKEFETRNSRKKYCSDECRNSNSLTKIINCEHCGKEFKQKRKNQKFCSKSCCGASQKRGNKTCEHCGKEFYPCNNRVKYCSHKCSELASRKIEAKECEYCHNIFTPHHANQKFCSQDCVHLSQKIDETIVECKNCGIKFARKITHVKEENFCSPLCCNAFHGRQHLGENNPNWRDDLTEEDRLRSGHRELIPGYIDWVKRVYKKFNYTCQKCGNKNNIHAHHIENFCDNKKDRTNIDNGVVLCEKCHREFHKKYGQRGNNKKQLEEFLEEELNHGNTEVR